MASCSELVEPWGSLWRRERGSPQEKAMLAEWPVQRPDDWLVWVNQAGSEAGSEAELEALRRSVSRGCPYGQDPWRERTAELGFGRTLRPPARPPKPKPPKLAKPTAPGEPATSPADGNGADTADTADAPGR